MGLNEYGKRWVDSTMAAKDVDGIYASIGANDEEAVNAYLKLERERLEGIALRHQDDPEFQLHASR